MTYKIYSINKSEDASKTNKNNAYSSDDHDKRR